MPLRDVTPVLDDRAYDDLIAEIKARIPSYTPEWTDLNDNEPGMALVQVFAWLTDQMLYRLGRVPALNEIKFLELLGIELRPAAPATAEITFPARAVHPEPTFIVPSRTRISASGDDGPTIFETVRATTCLTAPLVTVQVFDGFAYADVSGANAAPEAGFTPFTDSPAPGRAMLLGFAYPAASPLAGAVLLPPAGSLPIELDLAFWTAATEAGGKPAYSDCAFASLRLRPPATIVWEGWDGANWRIIPLLRDDTLAFTRSGHVLLRLPSPGFLTPAALGAEPAPRFYLRARLEDSGYERAPRLWAVRTNTVPAEAAQTAQDEILGGSDGSPNQKFYTVNRPLVAGSLRLMVDEGTSDGEVEWREVEDPSASGPQDAVYVLNRAAGEIALGDGTNGKIPTANPTRPDSSIIARSYRYGGGKRGNVAASKITTLMVTVSGVDEAAVTNLRPAAGGTDEETLPEAKTRARRGLRGRGRAVTVEDYENIALEAGLVKRAKALPRFHPDFPGVDVPGAITIIVVPDTEDDAPAPQEPLRRAVCACLAGVRMLTTELYVTGPTYRKIAVQAEIIARDDGDLAAIKRDAEKSLFDYFHPLHGGDSGDGWPFGEKIFYSKIFQRFWGVSGVEAVERMTIFVDGIEQPAFQDVLLGPNDLTYSHLAEHVVTPTYRIEGGS